MCRAWPSFRLAPEPGTFGSSLHTTDVEPTLLHPSPNTRTNDFYVLGLAQLPSGARASHIRELPTHDRRGAHVSILHCPDNMLAPVRQNLAPRFWHRPDKMSAPVRQNPATKFWHRPDKILAPPRQNPATKFWHRPDKMFARLSDECVGQPRPRIAGFCPPRSLNVLRILD